MPKRYTVLESWPVCQVEGEAYEASWFVNDSEIDDVIDPYFDNEADAQALADKMNEEP